MLAELMGALVAAVLFRIVRQEEFGNSSGLSTASDVEAITPFAFTFQAFEPGFASKCLSEFLGTFVLVLTVGLNIIVGSPAGPWAAAAALTCMVYSLGNVSGAQFNPAVTLAMVLRSRCCVRDGIAFVAAQLLAGVLAGLTVASFHSAGPMRNTTFELGPGIGYSPATAGFVELLFTFVLVYAVLASSTVASPAGWQTKQNNYFGLAIGSCMAAGGFAIGSVSGGELNPAVCLGIATASLSHHVAQAPPHAPLTNCLAFSTWELAGGLIAAAVFRKTHPGEFKGAPLLVK